MAVHVAEEIIATLVEAGVDVFFGVPGGPAMPLFDAILRAPGVRLVESRHETGAVFSAMGYWRATGRIPGVVVTSGPGATNVVTGIVAAFQERVPLILLCGDVAWSTTGGWLIQSLGPEGIGVESMLAKMTRAQVRIASKASATSQALAALEAAVDPRLPGPALVVLPIDQGLAAPSGVRLEAPARVQAPTCRCGIGGEVLERLARAQRPLLVLGTACRPHAEPVRDLVDALGVPFLTTPQAKGVVSEEHPLSLRTGGMAASWWARRYTAPGVDACLVLGTDLDDVSIGPTPYVSPDGYLAHVDLNPAVFNRNLRTSLGVRCDLGEFAHALAHQCAQRGLRFSGAGPLLEAAKARSPFDREDFREDDAPRVAPHRVIADLEAAAGECAVFVSDIGEHMLFALHYATAKGPDRFIIHLGLGSMGSGIGSAVGHALGRPERRVVCLCGDGCMQMSGSEILVAAKWRLPIVFAVMNDARYNMVYHGYKQQYGREAPWESPAIDFCAWAGAMGIRSARVERPGQITAELLDGLLASGGPAVLDIRHDPEVRIKGAGRIEALQQMSAADAGRQGEA